MELHAGDIYRIYHEKKYEATEIRDKAIDQANRDYGETMAQVELDYNCNMTKFREAEITREFELQKRGARQELTIEEKKRFLAYKLLEWAGICNSMSSFKMLPENQVRIALEESEHILSKLAI